ncbi:MAG: carboxypeptidase regulatory-like domain-containing protein [Pseudomonadota bacterium]|nr:carboxypeptidase regulatory-like domain-containing protein [Pseudomonadota bacterium]
MSASCLVQEEWPGADDRPVTAGATAAGGLAGTVTDTDGAPVAGALVTTDPRGMEATAAADGTYAIDRLLPGSYQVVANAPGFAPATSAEVTVVVGAIATSDVQLGPAEEVDGVLRLRVNGPEDTPWPGAVVTAVAETVTVSGTTDAAGELALYGLGGLAVDITVAEPADRLWPRHTPDVTVPLLGGVEVAFTLSGRAADGTRQVGTRLCAMCHADIATSLGASAHGHALSEDVEGPPAAGFDAGTTVDLDGATATLAWVEGAPVVRLDAADGESGSWTVLGLIGGAERGAVPWTERDGLAWPLPVAWVAADPTRPGWSDGGWIAGDTRAWFAADGSFELAPDPATSAEAACFGCHVSGFTLVAAEPAVSLRAVSGADARWDEPGVGCERCHGPGEDHTSGPLAEKSLRITNPADLDVDRANDVCGQCHAALDGAEGTAYAWDDTHALFLPGEALDLPSAYTAWPSGAAQVPGAQSDELARSGHGTGAWSARCTDCHDPHGSTIAADLRQEHEDNTLCLSCHSALSFEGSEAATAEHGGHALYDPGGLPGAGRCTGCHMPLTAARSAWSEASGAGDLASHRFVAIPPADSLAGFDAAGVGHLAPGAFSPNACQECHAWNDALLGGDFAGPSGDMTESATHEALQSAFEELYP